MTVVNATIYGRYLFIQPVTEPLTGGLKGFE